MARDAGLGLGEVGDAAAEERRVDAAGAGGAGELAGDLPGLAEDEGAHQALACVRPSRSQLVAAGLDRPATTRGCRDTSARSGAGRSSKRLRRRPAELVADLGRVDRVAEVVAGAVGDEGDQPLVRARRRGTQLVEQRADASRRSSRLLRSALPPML